MGMRARTDARKIKVEKQKLIDQIKANKETHVEEYNAAVIAYKKEAEKQLNIQQEKFAKGETDLGFSLVQPINREENYDKLVEMFEWEVEDKVELSQGEFNEYVLNETDFALQAKMANSTYLGG